MSFAVAIYYHLIYLLCNVVCLVPVKNKGRTICCLCVNQTQNPSHKYIVCISVHFMLWDDFNMIILYGKEK